jgi:ketosteroid isomerase-like protein
MVILAAAPVATDRLAGGLKSHRGSEVETPFCMESDALRRDNARAMPEENIEILRRGFEHFNMTREVDPDLFAPDAVMDNSEGIIDPGVHRGPEAIAEYNVALGALWTSQRVEPEEFIPVGSDRVIVPLRIVSIGRDGIEVAARTVSVFTLRDGNVTHWKTFQTKAEALKAAGPSE